MRSAIHTEVIGIAIAVADHDDDDLLGTLSSLEQAHIGIIDGYTSDGPGYAGKVAVIVWSGAPCYVTTLYAPSQPRIPEDARGIWTVVGQGDIDVSGQYGKKWVQA